MVKILRTLESEDLLRPWRIVSMEERLPPSFLLYEACVLPPAPSYFPLQPNKERLARCHRVGVGGIPELTGIDPHAAFCLLSVKLIGLWGRPGPGHCPAGPSTSLVNAASGIRGVPAYTADLLVMPLLFPQVTSTLLPSRGQEGFILSVLLLLGRVEAKRPTQAFRPELFIVSSWALCIWSTLPCLVDIWEYPVPPLPLQCGQNNVCLLALIQYGRVANRSFKKINVVVKWECCMALVSSMTLMSSLYINCDLSKWKHVCPFATLAVPVI